jgi:glycosyltransferase involved in cell wall biosynthesis
VVVGHLAGAELYGAERSLLWLLAAIDRSRYTVTCLLPGGSDAYLRRVSAHADDVAVFPYRWWSQTRPGDEATVARFEQSFRERQADLVHVNTITLMDPLIAARRLGIPSVLHAREIVSEDRELAAHLGGDASAIVATIKEAADFIIANSDATHRLYRKDGRSFRLYNCVDVAALDLPNEVSGGRLAIGIISSNLPKKGIAQFVRLALLAAERRSAFEFVVVGPRTPYVEELARQAGYPVNLRLAGYAAEPVEAVRQVNIVVSFSTVPESFGRTLAEGMAARRPVIAHDLGASSEIVRHGVDGFIIPPCDVAQAMAHLQALADDPTRIAAMGAAGRERAAADFAPAVFAANLDAIYRRILQITGQRGA